MKILILADTNLSMDSRIRRHIFALQEKYDLIVSGIKDPEISGNIEFINCEKKSISDEELNKRRILLRNRITNKKFEDIYWGEAYIQELYNNLKSRKFDLILANDISMVPLGVRLAEERKIKVIADMHEYAPRQFEDIEEWTFLFKEYNYYLCKNYLTKCDKVITVSEGLKKEYKCEFNIECSIITNAPKYMELEIKKTSDKIKMVYHGCVNKSRNIYSLIEMMNELDDRYSLDLYIIPDNSDKEYFNKFCEVVKKNPRCTIKKPIQPDEIVICLHQYDIGVYLLEPRNFNQKYALPNKFFEFIQARLAVAIGPSIEMKTYVDKYKCGVVSKDFTPKELTKLLNKLKKEEIDEFKINSDIMAKKVNSDVNKDKILRYIDEILLNGL